MSDDTCGWPTADGHGCKHPATGEDGRCWIPSHGEDGADAPFGRPSKFNDERARAACEAARMSKSLEGCGRAAGVDRTTIDYWVEKDWTFTNEAGEEVNFSTAFARARRDGETVLVQGGLRNDEIDTSMAKFLLSTSFGYVKTERRELEHDGALDVTSEVIEITEADVGPDA